MANNKKRRKKPQEWIKGYERENKIDPISSLIVFLALMIVAVLASMLIWKLSHITYPTAETAVVMDTNQVQDVVAESAADATPEPTIEPTPTATPAIVNGDTTMTFDEVAEAGTEDVTSLNVTTLRSVPSNAETSSIVAQIYAGEVIERIGINQSTGWSLLSYNDTTVYAVSATLTTSLDEIEELDFTQEGYVITSDGKIYLFTDCEDTVTAKAYVNMRTEPSTAQGQASVYTQLENGTTATRTGISVDAGWSRISYNGQTLYVVSSYLEALETEE